MENKIQTWRFLYTDYSTYKKAVTKTGALKEGKLSKAHFIITEGKDYAEAYYKARQECKFREEQLIGSRQIS